MEVEKSIIKKFRKEIWVKFIKAIKDFSLVNENDRVAVCISGGKDSFLLAKCMQELYNHSKIKFELKFIVMNPGYSEKHLKQIKANLELLNIEALIFDSPIFDIATNTTNPCYLCARMRRGYLYDFAKRNGCNKIALGHHFNDVIETILLNLIYNGTYGSMMPKLKSDNFEGMELIRPLIYVKEEDIIKWVKYNKLKFIDCACAVTKKKIGKRKEIKKLISYIDSLYIKGSKSIFTSMSNVNLNTVIGYKKDDISYSFLDDYDDKTCNK